MGLQTCLFARRKKQGRREEKEKDGDRMSICQDVMGRGELEREIFFFFFTIAILFRLPSWLIQSCLFSPLTGLCSVERSS